MGYRFRPNTGYCMPANFGPARAQDVAHYGDVTTYSLSYVTDKDALAALLPEPIEPADVPLVSVSCSVCKAIDFLAGGAYNIVQVNLNAVFNGKRDRVAGGYAAVLWENETTPIIMGRELLGAPKLYAEIRDPWRVGNTWRWYCSEYGTRLIEAEMRNFSPADEATCKRIEQDGRNGHWLCWKYIPRPDWKGAQLSIATDVRNRPTISQAWFGEGTVHFHDTPWEKTPTSADIMKGLRTLVVKEYRPAVITKGSNDLLVAETRMLE